MSTDKPNSNRLYFFGGLVVVLWAYLFHRFWQFAPLVTLACLAGFAVVAVFFVAARQLRCNASMRSLVLGLPLLVALCCVPANLVVRNQSLHQQVQSAGISEYSLCGGSWWSWLPHSIWPYSFDRLDTITIALETADVERLVRLPNEHLRVVVLSREDANNPARLDSRIVEWLLQSPSQPASSIELTNPEQAELEMLGGFPLPIRLSLKKCSSPLSSLALPNVTDLIIADSELTFSSPSSFELRDLGTVFLDSCDLSQGIAPFLDSILHARRVAVTNCSFREDDLSRLLNSSVKLLKFSQVTIPDSISIMRNDRATRQSIMFYNCDMSAETFCRLVHLKRYRRVLDQGSVVLSPGQMQRLYVQPDLDGLVISGKWLTMDHLRHLTSIDRRFTFAARESSVLGEEIEWLRERVNQDVVLEVVSGGNSTDY